MFRHQALLAQYGWQHLEARCRSLVGRGLAKKGVNLQVPLKTTQLKCVK